ncbi:MAG: response regulator [Deltaproteobacteria bacterium]|nr:response regulator [Deltaproteobacteria bacterium]
MTANREDDEGRSLLARTEDLEADLERARASVRFLEALLEAVPGFVLHVGEDLRVRSINREQPGITREQVIGAHVDDLMRADGARPADVRDAIATGAPAHYRARFAAPNGRPLQLECWAAPIAEPDGGRTAVIVAVDVTESREREERLREAQRLEAVGQLASGVAHNFNNMLAAILPALELVRPLLPPPRQQIVDEAAEAGFRAAEMVRQLMAFAGHRRGAPRRTEPLARIAGHAVGICRQLFPHHVVLEVIDRAEGACVHADPGEIEQVILNLLINARDAVVDRGHRAPRIRVTVDVAPGRDAASGAVPAARADERFARVRVEDDGIGMTEEVRRRIFEPFFTTKDVGRGTGLGLSTAWAAVDEHEGFLACSSIPGWGTTFDLLLPIAKRDDLRSERPSGEAPVGRGEKVLIVDDEPGVRDAVAMLLEDAGFHTTRAASAAEAIGCLHAGLDLVLLDRSMPGGIGDTVVGAVRARAPGAAVILFTGQEPPPEEAERVDDVLLKPATRGEILQAVRAALDATRRR